MEHSPKKYKLIVKIEEKALKKLQDEKAKLCVMKSFKSVLPQYKLTPVAWICQACFNQNNIISWEEEYEVFTAKPQVEKDQKLNIIQTLPIRSNQTFAINNRKGTGIIDPNLGGFGEGFEIINYSQEYLHFGLAQKAKVNGEDIPITPVCAQKDTIAGSSNIITPLPRIVVTFAPAHIEPGTIVLKSWDYAGFEIFPTTKKRTIQYLTLDPEDKKHRDIIESDERFTSLPTPGLEWGMGIPQHEFLLPYLLRYSSTAKLDEEDDFIEKPRIIPEPIVNKK